MIAGAAALGLAAALAAPPVAPPAGIASGAGQIAIRAVQGTEGGPAIAGADVELLLVRAGRAIEVLPGSLDEHGIVMFEGLRSGADLTPVAHIMYGGVTYQQPGLPMDQLHARQTIDVACFEVTDAPPPWRVVMRHVMVDEVPEGLKIAEVVQIENPTDRTWIGRAAPGARPATAELLLPPGATQVGIGSGFHDWCCTTLEKGTLLNHLPLMPGATELNLSYVLPLGDEPTDLRVVAPAPMDQLMIVLPSELPVEAVDPLRLGGTEEFGERTIRYFDAGNLEAGETVRLMVTGSSRPAEPVDGRSIAKVVAAAGGGLILLVAVVLVIGRGRSAGAA